MQDGAPAHNAWQTKEFLESNKINKFYHPSCSPDLNPIESIWGWMKY